MSLGRKVFAAPARLWMNWPLWGGLLATLLLAKHAWVLFAPAERAVPVSTDASQSAQTAQLFGAASTATASASLNGIRPVGIFASNKNGFAVMMTANGQVGVGLGSEVAPGIRLVETHADYVVLESNGARHRVDLKPETTTGDTVVPANTAPPPSNVPAGAPNKPVPLLEHLTPQQRAMLHRQQQELIRGRH
jgi:general secretion pathway protein C